MRFAVALLACLLSTAAIAQNKPFSLDLSEHEIRTAGDSLIVQNLLVGDRANIDSTFICVGDGQLSLDGFSPVREKDKYGNTWEARILPGRFVELSVFDKEGQPLQGAALAKEFVDIYNRDRCDLYSTRYGINSDYLLTVAKVNGATNLTALIGDN